MPCFRVTRFLSISLASFVLSTAGPAAATPVGPVTPVLGKHVIFDTDADNEVDDQHALAYVVLNSDLWTVDGITTNHTSRGGHFDNTIANDTQEAERVLQMLGSTIKVYAGVGGKNTRQVDDSVAFSVLKNDLGKPSFEGKAAVDFIVERARAHTPKNKLVILAVGKLTNVALALAKDKSIVPKVRVLWLGTNYPGKEDEHNARHDFSAVNALMDSAVEFDIATVRYSGKPVGGTAAVVARKADIVANMKGAGPQVSPKVPGRDNLGEFGCFGDYSVALFPHDRPLFDVSAVALEKNRTWARAVEEGAPILQKEGDTWTWIQRPNNKRKVRFYEAFDGAAINNDFYSVMKRTQIPQLASEPPKADPPNTLTLAEKKAGFKLLFDGKTTTGWRGFNRPAFPDQGWGVVDGAIKRLHAPVAPGEKEKPAGDLISVDEYSSFELRFDYQLTEGGNSGLKYLVDESLVKNGSMSGLGFEFQLVDDAGNADAKLGRDGNRSAGALYDLIAPSPDKKLNPVGQWNSVRLIVDGAHTEHWLNGVKVVSYERGSPELKALLAQSKYKNIPGFGEPSKGHILLQDHPGDVQFRSIRIRPISAVATK